METMMRIVKCFNAKQLLKTDYKQTRDVFKSNQASTTFFIINKKSQK